MTELDDRKAAMVSRFAERCGYRFRNSDLLFEAMTHSSAKEQGLPCNERLEFLGDSILGHVVCEYLFHRFPQHQEGELSVTKSVLVSAKYLSRSARDLGLDEFIITGKGISENKLPKSLLANAFEAAIAAIYLDAGLDVARDFIMKFLVQPSVESVVSQESERNYKSLLQDYVQKNALPLPQYRVHKAVGPDHRKRFQVFVGVAQKDFGPTWGYSKKEAEQKAARAALIELGILSESASPLPPEGRYEDP
jgi:ribonuclease-3